MPVYIETSTVPALHPETLYETLLLYPSITKYVSPCYMMIEQKKATNISFQLVVLFVHLIID